MQGPANGAKGNPKKSPNLRGGTSQITFAPFFGPKDISGDHLLGPLLKTETKQGEPNRVASRFGHFREIIAAGAQQGRSWNDPYNPSNWWFPLQNPQVFISTFPDSIRAAARLSGQGLLQLLRGDCALGEGLLQLLRPKWPNPGSLWRPWKRFWFGTLGRLHALKGDQTENRNRFRARLETNPLGLDEHWDRAPNNCRYP